MERGVELYVPSARYYDPKQYADGQEMLFRLKRLGLLGQVEVIQVDNLAEVVKQWDVIIDPSKAIKLPFIVVATGGEMGIINGYSGLFGINALLEPDYTSVLAFKK
jgi:hypothetical protein